MNNNKKYVYTYIISHIYINIYRTIFFFFFLYSGLKNLDGIRFCSIRNEK